MEWLFGIALAVFILAIYVFSGDSTRCKECGEETVEVGYSGYKRKCMHCGWHSK